MSTRKIKQEKLWKNITTRSWNYIKKFMKINKHLENLWRR